MFVILTIRLRWIWSSFNWSSSCINFMTCLSAFLTLKSELLLGITIGLCWWAQHTKPNTFGLGWKWSWVGFGLKTKSINLFVVGMGWIGFDLWLDRTHDIYIVFEILLLSPSRLCHLKLNFFFKLYSACGQNHSTTVIRSRKKVLIIINAGSIYFLEGYDN